MEGSEERKPLFPWKDKEILRYLGGRGKEVPDNVGCLITECKNELERTAVFRSVWREYPLAFQDRRMEMGGLQVESAHLEKNLRDCERVLFFGATLGSQVDVLLHRYERLQMSKAVVLQAASAALLEAYCDEENERLRQRYRGDGWYLRPRFSPGYGDFPLESQRQIAAALELGKRIGVTLTDSLLMAPSKSVTAVIGLSRIPRDCRVDGCEACEKKDCVYRR